MLVRSLVPSYSKMVKCSSTATLSSVFSAGPEDRARKVGVASAVSLLLVALGEGANVSGVIAQGILTICGDYFSVSRWMRCTAKQVNNSALLASTRRISGRLLCTGPRPRRPDWHVAVDPGREVRISSLHIHQKSWRHLV